MSHSMAELDPSFRPKLYFSPLDLETRLRATVRGRARRAELERYIAAGRLGEAPEFLIRDRLTEAERSAQSRIHPFLMGGEFLADRREGEIEIARISIESSTYDVTSVYARQAEGTIHYRVVDEYEGGTLTKPVTCTSNRPLKLDKLGRFFLNAWPLLDVIEMNFGFCDLASALKFARGESAFYPQFGDYIDRMVVDWVTASRDNGEGDQAAENGANS